MTRPVDAAPDPLYLCLDQGGHASRALVFNARGALQASAFRDVGTVRSAPDRVEHDPEELIASLREAIAEVVSALGERAANLAAAAIATQRSSVVCWDRHTGAALSPVISWQDRRAHAWLQEFSEHTSEIHRRTGLLLSAHYGASKLRWCLDHLPAVAAQCAGRLAMGPLASFLLFRLLEERPLLADSADVARTLLWNIDTQDWDPWLLELFGIPRASLPRCVPTRHAFGTLRLNDRRIPLELASGDQSAALFALGAPQPETAYVNLGTGAFIQRVFPRRPEAAGLLTGIAYSDADRSVYVLEGTVNGADAALRWAGREWGLKNIDAELPDWLARAGEIPVFLNGVSGLGAPYWVAEFASRLIGDGAPWQKAVAVAESIVFLLQANLSIMQKISPPVTCIIATGGLAWFDGLCRRLADLSGLPVYRPVEQEATARGTAYLLAGFPKDWAEERPGEQFTPQSDAELSQRYERWCAEMHRALGR